MEHFDLVPMDEESKILIHHIELTYEIEKVEPVYFLNVLTGHEILTYNNKKLYIGKRIVISDNTDTLAFPFIDVYDFNNVLKFQITNNSCYWNNALNQAHFISNYITLKNILFSRLNKTQFNTFYMIGYRITLK